MHPSLSISSTKITPETVGTGKSAGGRKLSGAPFKPSGKSLFIHGFSAFTAAMQKMRCTIAILLLAFFSTSNVLAANFYSTIPTANYSGSGNYTLGYEFTPNTDIIVTSFRSYYPGTATIWNASGVSMGSQTSTGTAGTWTNQANLTTPIGLVAGHTYLIGLYVNGTYYYNSAAMPTTFANGTIQTGAYASGNGVLTTVDNVQWLVDVNYSLPVCYTTTTSWIPNGAIGTMGQRALHKQRQAYQHKLYSIHYYLRGNLQLYT